MEHKRKNVVFITSVIKCTDKPLSYSVVRSVFTTEERFMQTVQTIHSIRKHMPYADIALFELGLDYTKNHEIKKLVDTYIDLSKDKLVRLFVDSKYKGLGEAYSILKGIRMLGVYSHYIKISGRYILTKDISESSLSEGFGFVIQHKNYSTRLYTVSSSFLNKFIWILKISLLGTVVRSIEKIFYVCIPRKWVHEMKDIGLTGHIAVDRNVIIE